MNFYLTFFSLLLVVSGVLSESATTGSCPNFPYFWFWINRMCPAAVKDDLKCVVGLPVDIFPIGQLNCGTVDDLPNPSLSLINTTTFLELLQTKDSYGRPWCMLSLFYSPDCVFSAKVAQSFYHVAPLFPKLRVVALDVSLKTKEVESLVNHFGIASTPVMALWEVGVPRFRLFDDYSNIDNLIKVIHSQTDLRKKQSTDEKGNDRSNAGILKFDIGSIKKPETVSLEEFLEQFKYLKNDLGFDWYFLVAVITLIINTIYFVVTSPKALNFIRSYAQHFIM